MDKPEAYPTCFLYMPQLHPGGDARATEMRESSNR